MNKFLPIFCLVLFSVIILPSHNRHEKKIIFLKKVQVEKVDVQKDTCQVHKNILIGDSQTPFVDWGSENFELISKVGSKKSLWLGGQSLSWLLTALKEYKVDVCVSNVGICIGTNGGFNKKRDDISGLISEIKNKFPNANLYVIQGSWGWGGVSNKTETQVRNYYKVFDSLGVKVVEPPIGKIEPHGRKPIYKIIGQNLDSLIKNN